MSGDAMDILEGGPRKQQDELDAILTKPGAHRPVAHTETKRKPRGLHRELFDLVGGRYVRA